MRLDASRSEDLLAPSYLRLSLWRLSRRRTFKPNDLEQITTPESAPIPAAGGPVSPPPSPLGHSRNVRHHRIPRRHLVQCRQRLLHRLWLRSMADRPIAGERVVTQLGLKCDFFLPSPISRGAQILVTFLSQLRLVSCYRSTRIPGSNKQAIRTPLGLWLVLRPPCWFIGSHYSFSGSVFDMQVCNGQSLNTPSSGILIHRSASDLS